MILGAGETSELTAGALPARGVQSIFVANRAIERAAALRGKDERQGDPLRRMAARVSRGRHPHRLDRRRRIHVLTAAQLAPIMRTAGRTARFSASISPCRAISSRRSTISKAFIFTTSTRCRHRRPVDGHPPAGTGGLRADDRAARVEFSEWLAGGWTQETASAVAVGSPVSGSPTAIVLGTRGSALALAQAELDRGGAARGRRAVPIEEQKVFVTRGDQKLDLSLIRANRERAGQRLFTKELEDALLGRHDRCRGAQPEGFARPQSCPARGHRGAGARAHTADVLITKERAHFHAILPKAAHSARAVCGGAGSCCGCGPICTSRRWRGNVQTRLRKLRESKTAGSDRARRRPASTGSASTLRAEGFFVDVLPAAAGDRAGGDGAPMPVGRRGDQGASREDQSRADVPCIRAERELQRLLAGDCRCRSAWKQRCTAIAFGMRAILFGEENQPPSLRNAKPPPPNRRRLRSSYFNKCIQSERREARP